MATQFEKRGGLTLPRSGPESLAPDKPKAHEELGLCVALVVLLVWALYVGLGGVDWTAVSHTFRTLL